MPKTKYVNAIETAKYVQIDIKQQIEIRNDAIRAAHSEGHSLREIAEHVGLSHTQIANIVR